MKKDLYEAPTVQVIEMEVQGVIAMSGGVDGNPPYRNDGDPFGNP